MTINALNTGGQLIQLVYMVDNSVTTLSSNIPRNDSIPQNTEGSEVLTLTITPTLSTTILLMQFSAPFACPFMTPSNDLTVALFQDDTVDALAASNHRIRGGGTGDSSDMAVLRYTMVSGTTSSTTFKIRCGPGSNAAYLNADASGTRLMGGVSYVTFSIKEFHA